MGSVWALAILAGPIKGQKRASYGPLLALTRLRATAQIARNKKGRPEGRPSLEGKNKLVRPASEVCANTLPSVVAEAQVFANKYLPSARSAE